MDLSDEHYVDFWKAQKSIPAEPEYIFFAIKYVVMVSLITTIPITKNI